MGLVRASDDSCNNAPKRVAEALDQIAHGAVAGGATLAALATNQIEEKYDWALTPELRSVDYASRHFDEPGACDAAMEILASLPNANPHGHSH